MTCLYVTKSNEGLICCLIFLFSLHPCNEPKKRKMRHVLYDGVLAVLCKKNQILHQKLVINRAVDDFLLKLVAVILKPCTGGSVG